MKQVLQGSIILILFALAISLFQISCKKDAVAQTNTPLTKKEILVQKPWRIDQLHRVINGVYASYYYGGANSTGVTYDNTRYTFKADGSAVYIDDAGVTHTATWEFTSPDQRVITFTYSGAPYPDIWQMVEISGNYLHVTENFKVGTNTNNLHSFRLVQIP
jgi:hypothetical protein